MEVSRQTALEIFGLKDDFTSNELNQAFRRISKLVHPDTGGDDNLFRFIMCCKETLSNNVNTHKTQKTQESRESKTPQKIRTSVRLTTLYNIYYNLNDYTDEYDIVEIIALMRIHISPRAKKKQWKNANVEMQQPFYEFEHLGFANFITTIPLPETFKKFKKFNIRVEFMGETYKFKLSMKNPFHIIKYDSLSKFDSIIELTFQ